MKLNPADRTVRNVTSPLPAGRIAALCLLLGWLLTCVASADSVKAAVKDLTLNGGIQDGRASLIIEAILTGSSHDDDRLIHSTAVEQITHVTPEQATHRFHLTLDILQGQPKEIPLVLSGDGEVRSVEGEGLLDWSIRWGTNNTRYLVLRFPKSETPIERFQATITADTDLSELPSTIPLLTLTPEEPALFGGFVAITSGPDVKVDVQKPEGLALINSDSLPEPLLKRVQAPREESLAYRFHGRRYQAWLVTAFSDPDPEKTHVVLRNFQLTGNLDADSATFTLTAEARVGNPRGGEITLLSGGLALTAFEHNPDWDLRLEKGRYILACDKPGTFPIQMTFNATVTRSAEWNSIHFHVAPSTLQPMSLTGLPSDTEFKFDRASKPERDGNRFLSFLPTDGTVMFSWKAQRKEAEGRLFYAAEMLSQITISPGLMRQVALMDFRVMQGEMSEVALRLEGEGEVTRVQGDPVLSWRVDRVPDPANAV